MNVFDPCINEFFKRKFRIKKDELKSAEVNK